MSRAKVSKLKSDKSLIVLFIISVALIILMLIFFKEKKIIFYSATVFYFLITFFFFVPIYLKTKNKSVLAMFLNHLALLGLCALRIANILSEGNAAPLGIGLCFITALIIKYGKFPNLIWYRYLRIFLEWAAKSVYDTNDGYTGRPYPAGKASYSKNEIVEFAKYMNKNLIATSYIKDDRVILVFSNGMFQYILFLKPNLQKVTYVSFDYEGNSSVYIAKKDYRKYKEELTFDQLCNSFGNVVLDLFNGYRDGQRAKILNKIKGQELKQPFWPKRLRKKRVMEK